MTKKKAITKVNALSCLGCQQPINIQEHQCMGEALTPEALTDKRHVVVCHQCGEVMELDTTYFTFTILTAAQFVCIPYDKAMEIAKASQTAALRKAKEQNIEIVTE